MREDRLEAAVPAGEDPRHYALAVARMREAAIRGAAAPAAVRPVIAASWERMNRLGLDPDQNDHASALAVDEIEKRRRESGLADVLPVLRSGLVGLAEEAGHIMVVVDTDGRVLWRDGSSAVRRRADGLGFTEGANWHEDAVGTNAIGTALVAQRPVQVFSAEHYVRTHHAWTCAAAPLHSPRDGRLLGVVDISGPAHTVHATTLALVDAVAKLAEAQLRLRHMADLERLRAAAVPAMSRADGRALVTDPHGWVAAVAGLVPVDRVALPRYLTSGRVWLPAYGGCDVEPLPGGWLLRVVDPGSRPGVTAVVLDLSAAGSPTLTVTGDGSSWSHALTPRHAEILYILARHRAGRSARELALGLFGDPTSIVTVRAEMSRLRRNLAGILAPKPYRFVDGLGVRVVYPENGGQVLPHSHAPGVRD
jgi:hypothetical protein